MGKYEVVSMQTGDRFGSFVADSESAALDLFAQHAGFSDRRAMWNAGRFEYLSAVKVG